MLTSLGVARVYPSRLQYWILISGGISVAPTVIQIMDIESYPISDTCRGYWISDKVIQYPISSCHPSSGFMHSSG